MSKSENKGKVLLFVPHSDDLEFGAPFVAIHYLRLGWEVVEVLMTNSEYGTSRKEFKGNRLARIRKWEIEKTIRVYQKYTKNRLRLIRLGYIDGFLPLKNKVITRIIDLIRKEKPKIVLAPDPIYPLDFHYDHLNTGKTLLFALRKLNDNELPKKILFFYSFNNNYFIKIRCSDVKLATLALSQHRSQVVLFRIKLYMFYKRIQILLNIIRHQSVGIRYRRLTPENGRIQFEDPLKSIRNRIKFIFFSKTMHVYNEKSYIPPPEELGLINPE